MPPVLDIVSWDSGSGWTDWHIEQQRGQTWCGRAVPLEHRTSRQTVSQDHPVSPTTMCVTCLVFYREGIR